MNHSLQDNHNHAGGSVITADTASVQDLGTLLLNSTGEGIYGTDMDGNCTFANPSCVTLLGFESDTQLLGKHMHNLVHHTRPDGEPYPVEECHIYQAFRECEGSHVDDEIMFRADGSSFPAEYRSYPVQHDGELLGCVVTFVDITQRVEDEANLKQQQELVTSLLNSTGEGIYGTDMNGVCIFANPACAQLLGFESDAQLLGQNMHRLVHHTRPNGEPYPIEECQIFQAFRSSKGSHVDDEIMFCSDGSSFPAEYWSFPLNRNGELVGCVVTFVDITERLKVQNELREQEELVRSLLNSTGEGIYGIDLDGNCTFANPSCVNLLGFESDTDVLGKHMHELVHHTRPNGDPYPVQECRIYQAFQQGEGAHVSDEVMFCADGTNFPAEYWSYPVERDGEMVGCVVTFVDITERLKKDEELRQTEKMAALGKLSAGLAHELNNPASAASRASSQLLDSLGDLQSATIELTRVGIDHQLWGSLVEWDRILQNRSTEATNFTALELSDHEDELLDWLDTHGVKDGWDYSATLAAAGIHPDDLEKLAATVPKHTLGETIGWLTKSFTAQDLAGAIVLSASSISKLVNAAKSFSFMDQDVMQNVDVHQGIEDTITILGNRLKQGIDVIRDYDQDLPRIMVPGSELNQVWMNLLDNSIDALGNNGTITISTRQDDGNVVVDIADNGPGIPQEIQPHIFDPFFTTKGVGEGTGLGLDVVRRIITVRCQGDVGFESDTGGTAFWVKLPI
ncbi:MAG: PAS domain S-box protein [SAR202 cluster bacterium]|jgi:PAS domain S-box-containing protein|nr:PAS domain S-box protein [SAR202 cluster bacterium]